MKYAPHIIWWLFLVTVLLDVSLIWFFIANKAQIPEGPDRAAVLIIGAILKTFWLIAAYHRERKEQS